jgi:hypothetical protein
MPAARAASAAAITSLAGAGLARPSESKTSARTAFGRASDKLAAAAIFRPPDSVRSCIAVEASRTSAMPA